MTMQCKDIPEQPILDFIAKVERDGEASPYISATWFWTNDWKPENSVVHAMPEGTPPKLALAKMKSMIRKGLVEGCACGCRGDFTVARKTRT